MDKSIIN